MVDPLDIPRVLLDAARLMKGGEIVVFGSASLAFWLRDAPSTRDIDVWTEPVEHGDIVTAIMGELSWYHDKHGVFLEVWGPETFAAPKDWRTRAKSLHDDGVDTILVVPHPHDVLLAKVERWSPSDRAHAVHILQEFPMSTPRLEALVTGCPARGRRVEATRKERFKVNLASLRSLICR